jgi:hypothetical protein
LAEILRQRFFGKRAADASVAVLERMNAHEVQMRDGGAAKWTARL